MTRYEFLWAKRVIMSNVQTDSQLYLILILVKLFCELRPIMTLYDFDKWYWNLKCKLCSHSK